MMTIMMTMAQEVLEELDPSLEPILSRAIVKVGNRQVTASLPSHMLAQTGHLMCDRLHSDE